MNARATAILLILLLVSVSISAAYKTDMKIVKETFSKEFSPTITERIQHNDCLSTSNSCTSWNNYTVENCTAWNNSSGSVCTTWNNYTVENCIASQTYCASWNNYTTAGDRTYTFTTDGEKVYAERDSVFDYPKNITINSTFKHTALTATVLNHLNPNDKTDTFNSNYFYSGENITSAELTALQDELVNITNLDVRGKTDKKNKSIDLQSNTETSISVDASQSVVSGSNRQYKVRWGNHSLNWTVTSSTDWDASLSSSIDNTTTSGSIQLSLSGTGGSWEQTTQANFDAGVKTDVSTTIVTGSVVLNASVIGTTDLTTGMTATAESVYQDNPSYVASKAIDDNTGTNWNSGQASVYPQWWKVDLGSAKSFSRIMQLFGGASTTHKYNISGSLDDSTYTEFVNATSQWYGSSVWETNNTAIQTWRYVKFEYWGGGNEAGVLEIIINQSLYASSGTITSQINDTGAQRTFTNMSINGTYPSFCQPNCNITINLSTSPDNSTWTTTSDFTNSTNGTQNFDFANVANARYIRWNATLQTNDTSYTAQLHDIIVYYSSSYVSSGTYRSLVKDLGRTYTLTNASISGVFSTTANATLNNISYSTDNTIFTPIENTTVCTSNCTFDFDNKEARYLSFNLTLNGNVDNTSVVNDFILYYSTKPGNATFSANRTYAKQGLMVNLTALYANDSDSGTMRLLAGNTSPDGSLCTGADIAVNGTPFCEFSFPWADDNVNHTIYVQVQDGDTANSTNTTLNVTSDDWKPNITLYMPNATNQTIISAISINYTASDTASGISTVWYSIWNLTNGSRAVLNATIAANTTIGFDGEGKYNITFYSNDSVGFENNTGNVTFWLDRPPVFSNATVSNSAPARGAQINISVAISDNFTNVEKGRVVIALPSGDSNSYALIKRAGRWYYNYTTAQDGSHTTTFYADDESTDVEGSSSGPSFSVPISGTSGGPSSGGGGGGVITIVEKEVIVPEGEIIGGLKLQYKVLDSSFLILPWDEYPLWQFSVSGDRDIIECKTSGVITCKIIGGNRVVLSYAFFGENVSPMKSRYEVKDTLYAFALMNNSTDRTIASMPIKLTIWNLGVYLPTEQLRIPDFPGRALFFKGEKNPVTGELKTRGVLLYWMGIALIGAPLAVMATYKKRDAKRTYREATLRRLGVR